MTEENYCCEMRRHFVVGILGETRGEMPLEVADFVVAWEPKIIIAIRYCPFCGNKINKDETTRTIIT